ncbi:MAG: hypothetical protein FJY79_09340 [Candidatus Aminicenantes bacterium]|nr:hypothetical protein [Candidatus Aminicenantes bacterium]
MARHIINLPAQRTPLRPGKYACPVPADLSPRQSRSADILRFEFPENQPEIPTGLSGHLSGMARRFSISLLTPDGSNIEIPFKWKGIVFFEPRTDWGERAGVLVARGDGSPNCYYLGPAAGLPENVPCVEFVLFIPRYIEVKDASFSSAIGEYISEDCPMPELEKQINEAYDESRRAPRDAARAARFISLLEKAIPEYGCISKNNGYPAPALFLAGLDNRWKWIDHLYLEVDRTNDHALRVFAEIYNIFKEGVLAEVMDDQIWRVLHNRPRFILRNWDGIKNQRRNVLASRWLQDPESIDEMIGIYRDIAIKEPKYRAACEEIIGILREKNPAG